MAIRKETVYICDVCRKEETFVFETDEFTTSYPNTPPWWITFGWQRPEWVNYLVCSPGCLYVKLSSVHMGEMK